MILCPEEAQWPALRTLSQDVDTGVLREPRRANFGTTKLMYTLHSTHLYPILTALTATSSEFDHLGITIPRVSARRGPMSLPERTGSAWYISGLFGGGEDIREVPRLYLPGIRPQQQGKHIL
ncbi:unnamed protein product [Nezara viridula]|uniref:Uncharacterized protein n=1 Tax=Nezara viridula TaxID=85310 RepID=A0A9P0MWB6_NEZVI|nr:unnamed protein product [Nezara viridula]